MKSCASLAISAVCLASGLLAAAPAQAAVTDWKTVDATVCQPYGPGTSASELVYNQLGVTNPGVTNESVMCPMPVDGDVAWSATPGTGAVVYAYFRAGATAGRIVCTAFASKASIVTGPTYSVTSNAGNVAAGARSQIYLMLADTTAGGWTTGPTTVLLCTLMPKVTLAGFSFIEGVITNTP